MGIDGRFAGLFAARRTLCAWPALLGSRGAGAVTLPSPREPDLSLPRLPHVAFRPRYFTCAEVETFTVFRPL